MIGFSTRVLDPGEPTQWELRLFGYEAATDFAAEIVRIHWVDGVVWP